MAPILSPLEVKLRGIYRGNTQGSLRGAVALYTQAKKLKLRGLTLEKVKAYLQKEPVYYKYRRVKTNFKRRKIYSPYTGALAQGDLWILDRFAASNTFLYAFIIVDTFSKHLSLVPITNKTISELKRAMKYVLDNCGYKIDNLLFDGEGGMHSKEMVKWLEAQGVRLMRTLSKTKAPLAEVQVTSSILPFHLYLLFFQIRTLRVMLQRRMEISGRTTWDKEIAKIVKTINERPHSTTGLPPNAIVSDPLALAFPATPPTPPAQPPSKTQPKLPKPGDFVVISRAKAIFDKEATGNMSAEIFRIVKVDKSSPIPMFQLADLAGDKIIGSFYREEIFVVSEQKLIPERIHERRKDGNGRWEFLVSFKDAPKTLRRWTKTRPKGLPLPS